MKHIFVECGTSQAGGGGAPVALAVELCRDWLLAQRASGCLFKCLGLQESSIGQKSQHVQEAELRHEAANQRHSPGAYELARRIHTKNIQLRFH